MHTDRDALLARRKKCKETAKNGNGFGLTLGNWLVINGWDALATPSARDWRSGKSNQHGKNARPLNEQFERMTLPTPNAGDYKAGESDLPHRHQVSLTRTVRPSQTGRLAFLILRSWMMGLPTTWLEKALGTWTARRKSVALAQEGAAIAASIAPSAPPKATRSSRKSPKRSAESCAASLVADLFE